MKTHPIIRSVLLAVALLASTFAVANPVADVADPDLSIVPVAEQFSEAPENIETMAIDYDQDGYELGVLDKIGKRARWVSREQLEAQLRLIHGKIPDAEAGLFGPDSMMWKIGREMAPGGFGAGRALILQVSHPWISQGIDQHSEVRADPLERGRNTFRYILTILFGNLDQAMAAADEVHRIHERIQGEMPFETTRFAKHSEYRANEIDAMIWVHATLWETFILMYEQAIGRLKWEEKEQFYQETKLFAYMFGIPDEALPANWAEFLQYCDDMRNNGTLEVTPQSKQLVEYLFGWHGVMLWLPMKYQRLLTAANLPDDLREGYGFKYGFFRRSFYNTTMFGWRVFHVLTPGVITHNPAYKEANARLKGKKAGWFTRLELKMAFGNSRLTNDR